MEAIGLLVARLIVGLAMAAHGSQKAFGWFGGHGLKGTGGFFESIGYRPGIVFATLAAWGEIVGGVLTAAGLFGPLGPALIIMVMIVAAGTLHVKNGFFAQQNGFELNAFYIAAALALTFGGPGSISLDSAFGLGHYYTSTVTASTLAAAVVLGFINLRLRNVAPPSDLGTAARS
jgi:putative oxidoreductase